MPFLQKELVQLTFFSRRSSICKSPPHIGGSHFLLCQHTNTKDIAGQSATLYHTIYFGSHHIREFLGGLLISDHRGPHSWGSPSYVARVAPEKENGDICEPPRNSWIDALYRGSTKFGHLYGFWPFTPKFFWQVRFLSSEGFPRQNESKEFMVLKQTDPN